MKNRWLCTLCGRTGTVRYRKHDDVLTVSEKIRSQHQRIEWCRYDPDAIMLDPPASLVQAMRSY